MRLRRAAACSLPALLQLVHFTRAELRDVPTVDNFVRRFSNAAIVLGSYVYIDGGDIVQLENGTIRNSRDLNQVNSTLSLDLTKSWTTSEVVFRAIPKAPGPVKANVVLWGDRVRNSFYSWGGKWEFGQNMKKAELWKFSADGSGGGKWSVENPSNPSTFNGLVPSEYMAFTTVNNTGYAIGGTASGWTQLGREHSQTIPGMLSYNFDTKEWTNGTMAEGFSPLNTLAMASAHYVPIFGPGGLVMVMGGCQPEVDQEPSFENSPNLNFENLTFFDPGAKKTFSQKATGDIPPSPRTEFCMTGFQNTDGGYEIFIFGGENRINNRKKYKDAYILSLPGFVWTKLPDAPAGGRAYHQCVAVGRRQVLSIGGVETVNKDRDKAPQGLLVYDMTAMKWNDFYDANLPAYEAPDTVKRWYKQNSLDKVQWSSDEVKQLFVKRTEGSGNSGQLPIGATESAGTPVAAIVGGVLGGVIGLAVIGVLWWLLFRRRKSLDAPAHTTRAKVEDGAHLNEPQDITIPAEISNDLGYSELAGYGRGSPKPEKHYNPNGYAELPQSGGGMGFLHGQAPRVFAAELDGAHLQR